MAKVRVTIDSGAIARLQQQANSAAQAVLDRVTKDMCGHPELEVLRRLMDGMRAANLQPNEQSLRKRAKAISAGPC